MAGGAGGGTTARLAVELSRLLEPVGAAVSGLSEGDPDRLERLLDGAGIAETTVGDQYAAVKDIVSDVSSSWVTIRTEVLDPIEEGETPDPAGIEAALTAVGELFDTLDELDSLAFANGPDATIGEAFVDFLIATYLEEYHPVVYSFATLSGVVTEPSDGREVAVDLSMVPEALGNPERIPERALDWGTAGFKSYLLVSHLSRIQTAIAGIPGEETSDLFVLTDEQRSNPDLARQLDVPLFSRVETDGDESTLVEFGLVLAPVPGSPGRQRGLALAPYGEATLGTTVSLGSGWELGIDASAESNDWVLVAQPTGGSTEVRLQATPGGWPIDPGTLRSPSPSDTIPSFRGEAKLSRPDSDDATSLPLIGTPGATGLFLDTISVRGVIDGDGDSVRVAVELPADGRLVVTPEGGFLRNVLPSDVALDFSTSLGWSTSDGLYLEGGGTLEASLPAHVTLGPVTLREMYLGLVAGGEGTAELTVSAATSPALSVGPVDVSVKRMGVEADVSFPADGEGDLGPIEFDVGFRPPDGLSLSVDTGGITGGGFMAFEPENNRYSGGLELQFGSWGLKAVGLLKTELPGRDGYSLLVLVTADLPPIQLGAGFVMTGIGGLAGIHRGFEKKPLGEAVRSGNLDSVLFPTDVIANADQILTDLRAIFPPKGDRHVLGPMVQLGWGTPVIITAELGVLVSIPSWKVALLGKFMVDLPDRDVALIDLNLAVVGVLDVPNQELAIDASLYDSRIVSWTVSGDMAMRLSWGDDSRFVLSVGGFHPRYSPPTGFPKLDRVTASLSPPGGNPRLEYTGYFAVTPNTVQVGAGVVLHGTFGPAVVHGELSFDALFRFNPFTFVVDFRAGVSVTVSGYGFSLRLDGTLSGPQPYRVRGTLTVEILFASITVNVNATFGSSGGTEELPTADVLPELTEALKQPGNWDVQRPTGGHHLVTMQEPTDDNGGESRQPQPDVLLAHPLGTLSVRQQVVPLGAAIEKYGNAEPRHTTYELSELAVAGSDDNLAGQRQLREEFAPARFKEMSDSEKLQAEPFERLPAGRTMDNGIVHYAGADDPSLLSWATLAYESSVIDERNDQYRLDVSTVLQDFAVDDDRWDGRLGLALGHELAEQSAVATAGTRTTGSAAYENPDTSKRIGVSDQRYVVAWTDDLERVPVAANPAEGQTRVEAREAREEYLATHDVAPDAVQVVGVQELDGGSGGGGS